MLELEDSQRQSRLEETMSELVEITDELEIEDIVEELELQELEELELLDDDKELLEEELELLEELLELLDEELELEDDGELVVEEELEVERELGELNVKMKGFDEELDELELGPQRQLDVNVSDKARVGVQGPSQDKVTSVTVSSTLYVRVVVQSYNVSSVFATCSVVITKSSETDCLLVADVQEKSVQSTTAETGPDGGV